MNYSDKLGVFPERSGEQISLMRYTKTSCGVDFMLNTATSAERPLWFETGKSYKTDFFEFFFLTKASGHLRLGDERIDLHDGMLLIISPYQQQQWHARLEDLDYTFLVFQEEFVGNFLSDKYFMYRLLYCYQHDHPSHMAMDASAMQPFLQQLHLIRQELRHPVSDSYHMIVALLYQFLLQLNRTYAHTFGLPLALPFNNYAFEFKQLLEHNICTHNKVSQYSDMMGISRVTLNTAVTQQFGVSASHLLKQRLLQEVKNDLLFKQLSPKECAFRLHFSEVNHMMRFFKQQTGQTIGEWLADQQAAQPTK